MSALAPRDLHLGFNHRELAESPYAPFFRPNLAPLAEPVREALLTGPIAHELMPPAARAADLQAAGDWPAETAYTVLSDGSARVFVRTPMPGVTPAMWDWWFAWHGSEAQRYKLWHPRAHVHVAWADGDGATGAYVGRTSRVVEYVGAARLNLTVRFVRPASLGLDEARLAAEGQVAICARGGMAGAPVDSGWLIHHLRPAPGGCEMRSRFWVGGPNIGPRIGAGLVGRLATPIAARLARFDARQAADLLVHCAQEMSHLAAVLPLIHAAFGPTAAPEIGS